MSKYLETLETFTNIKFGELRGTWIDGKPWVVGIDVARALGYKDPANTIARKVKIRLAICQSDSNYKTDDIIRRNGRGRLRPLPFIFWDSIRNSNRIYIIYWIEGE